MNRPNHLQALLDGKEVHWDAIDPEEAQRRLRASGHRVRIVAGPRGWIIAQSTPRGQTARDPAPSRAKQRWISEKIRLLRHEGYPENQAIAIAYRMAGVPPKSKSSARDSSRNSGVTASELTRRGREAEERGHFRSASVWYRKASAAWLRAGNKTRARLWARRADDLKSQAFKMGSLHRGPKPSPRKTYGGRRRVRGQRDGAEGEFYADYDESTGLWCVFHTENPKAYVALADQRSAEREARHMNEERKQKQEHETSRPEKRAKRNGTR